MKGFVLSDGDLVITNNEIEITQETDLIIQTIQYVLSTHKGEWIFNEDEGIDFYNIVGKKDIDEGVIKSEIERGIVQVDSELVIEDFTMTFDKEARKLHIDFKARKNGGELMEFHTTY